MRSIPHACPVCKGRGEITEELAQHEAKPKYELAEHKIYSCHVCVGAGLIWEYSDDPVPAEQQVQNIFRPALPYILPNLPSIQINPEDLNNVNPWTYTLNSDGTIKVNDKTPN